MNKKLIEIFFQSRYNTPSGYLPCSDNLLTSTYKLKKDYEDTISWLEHRTGDTWKDFETMELINKSIRFLRSGTDISYYKEKIKDIEEDIEKLHEMFKFDENFIDFIEEELKF